MSLALAGGLLTLLLSGAVRAETGPDSGLQSAPGAPVSPPVELALAHGTPAPSHMQMTSGRLPDFSEPGSDTEDLTNLSLEQLLQLDLVGIDVLGSHTHTPGQIMIGYRFMASELQGYLDGDRSLGNSQVLKQFPTIHTSMQMRMHMLELMYAPSRTVTVMAMIPYQEMAMSHRTRAGGRFDTESSGLGDVTLMALKTVYGTQDHSPHRLLFNAGVSVPTGSINQRDHTPTGRNVILEYPMQLGTGTVGLLPGLTYLGQARQWAWGAQVMANVPLGRNERGYRFGNQYRFSGWAAYKLKSWLAATARLDLHRRENVEGSDPELNPASNPESNPDLQAGTRLYLVLGVNLYAPKGALKGHRINIEGGWPLYQSLSGPQLSDNWQISVGWTYTFQR